MMDHLLLFIILALFAEILGTIGGFGSSSFFIPIATMFLDIHSVLGVTALFHVSIDCKWQFPLSINLPARWRSPAARWRCCLDQSESRALKDSFHIPC